MILLAMFAIGLMSMVVAQVASTELAISANLAAGESAFLPADGASTVLLRDIMTMSGSLGRFPTDAELATIPVPSFTNVNLTQFQAFRSGAETPQPLSSGLLVGLSAFVQPFTMLVTAEADGPPLSRSTIQIQGEYAAIPILQFGVFYEDDLEINPASTMFLEGRVHSNSDIYLATSASLSLSSPVTSAGEIYNRRRSGVAEPGDVYIEDSEGIDQPMDGLDSDSPTWETDALERWDGRVRSSSLSARRFDLIQEAPADPRLIIEPGYATDTPAKQEAKLWYDADIRIVNGQGYDSAGNPISLIDPASGEKAIRETVIWDQREQKHMLTIEVDVDKLGRIPAFPPNPIVYVGGFEPANGLPPWPGANPGVGPAAWVGYDVPWSGTETTEFAVKLRHGTVLPSHLSLVTDNPAYIQGNFNSVNSRSAAVMADAVTILSNRWGDVDGDGIFDDDLAYSILDVNARDAVSTTVNAAILAGTLDPALAYNGGLENLPRLLERWSGDTLTLSGSLISMWRSIHADGPFGNPGVYSAPIRQWFYDVGFLDINQLPPGTPLVYQLDVTSWTQK